MGEGSGAFRRLEERLPADAGANAVVVVVASGVVAVAVFVAAVTIVRDGSLGVYGSAIALGFFGMAVAVRRFVAGVYPHVVAAQEREVAGHSDAPITEVAPVTRRVALGRVLAISTAVLVAGLLAPVASLGPRRPGVGAATAWGDGIRLVDVGGRPLREADVPGEGLATVWPEGRPHQELAAVVLVRLGSRGAQPPTNLEWVVNGDLVAYSKVCTHMGCPVGLFQAGSATLFCPCHQAAFDAARGARPTFGPPSRALPQLPLGTDTDGYLVALGDFTEHVGPAVG